MSISYLGEFPQKFLAIWSLEEIDLLLILLQGHVARAPTKGRHMGLPLPEIVICRYIRWGMLNNSASC